MSYFAIRLKTLRAEKQWSMQDLADKAGVSKSMICKIEREEVQPTIDVAARLAIAFGKTLSEMLHESSPHSAVLLTYQEQPIWVDACQIKRRNISPVLEGAKVEWLQVTLPPHTAIEKCSMINKKEFKYLLVTKGTLEFRGKQQTYHLKAGDSLSFDACIEHDLVNSTDQEVEYYIVIQRG